MSTACSTVILLAQTDPYRAARDAMVKDVERQGVRDTAVLNAMRMAPRHLFLPERLWDRAYQDGPLPIGNDATISQPYIVGRMTELLARNKTHRVLEIGTGSGYQAAVLSILTAKVYSIEIVPELARSAALRLTALGYRNVIVRNADGYAGWPEEAPFDGILLTAAPPRIPEPLVKQLAAGGRLVAPEGEGAFQKLVLLEKSANGGIRRTEHGLVRFVPMKKSGFGRR